MSELKQAGHYSLKSFYVIDSSGNRVDIKMLIHRFNIAESMSTGSVRGSAIVYDANDLITKFPIKAEEYIEITYSDYYDKELIETYFLYSITDVSYPKENSPDMVKYTLNFVSLGKLFSENFKVSKTYKPNALASRVSDYVKELYDEYYKKPLLDEGLPTKEIDVHDTVGTQTYVIPRFTPEQSMHFFSRKAYSALSRSQSFRFFENREKFYFATNEYMLEYVATGGIGYSQGVDPGRLAAAAGLKEKVIPIFSRNYSPDRTAIGQDAAMSGLIDIDFGTKTDTVDDINSGAYYRTTYEVDLINGTMNKIDYNHFAQYSENELKFPHEEVFVNRRINKPKERYIITDYAAAGNPGGYAVPPDKNYSALHNVKTSYFYHYNKNKVNAVIYGRNTLFAGSAIDIELTKHSADSTQNIQRDNERSGRYIVESIENVFDQNVFTQKLVLSRAGVGK